MIIAFLIGADNRTCYVFLCVFIYRNIPAGLRVDQCFLGHHRSHELINFTTRCQPVSRIYPSYACGELQSLLIASVALVRPHGLFLPSRSSRSPRCPLLLRLMRSQYNDAVGDAADGILLNNILRSEYIEPLNLSQLSSVSGALSLQGTVAFFRFRGALATGGAPSSIGQRSAAPGVTASTSPTYTLTPLNTQAFIQSILQPVSPAYVLNRWQAGISHELLLLLFVKEIDFPRKTSGIPYSFINDPDDTARFTAFKNLIDSLVLDDAELKDSRRLGSSRPGIYLKYGHFRSYHDGHNHDLQGGSEDEHYATPYYQYHGPKESKRRFKQVSHKSPGIPMRTVSLSGNVLDDAKKQIVRGQLYRVYAGQVELCVNPNRLQIPTYADSDSKDAIFGLATQTVVTNPPTPPQIVTYAPLRVVGIHSLQPLVLERGTPAPAAAGKGTAAATPSSAGLLTSPYRGTARLTNFGNG